MLDCEECRHLWRDYAETISNYFKLDRRLKGARLEQGNSSLTDLYSLIEAASAGRVARRDAIRRHMSAVHGGSAATRVGERRPAYRAAKAAGAQ